IRYPISGMWGGDRDDLDGLREFAVKLRNLGYYGMMLGDPVYIPVVHDVFTPSPAEVTYWQDLDPLATEAERHGRRPARLRGPQPGRGPRRAHRPRRLGPQEPAMGTRLGCDRLTEPRFIVQ